MVFYIVLDSVTCTIVTWNESYVYKQCMCMIQKKNKNLE